MYPCPPKIPVVHEPPKGDENPYNIQLDPLSIYRATQSVESDAQLQERIRQENWGRQVASTQWLMMNPYQSYFQAGADISFWQERAGWSERMSQPGRQYVTASQAQYYQDVPQAKVSLPKARYLSHPPEAKSWSPEIPRGVIEDANRGLEELPDPEKVRQQILQRELSRARSNPFLYDIWTARSLNGLLRQLIAQDTQVARGLNVPLEDNILAHLNLTSGDGSAIVGLLKNQGKLQWPAVLQGKLFEEARERLSALLQTACTSANSGNAPDDATMSDLRANCKKLRDTLRTNVDQFMPDEYITAHRFLLHVEKAIAAFKNPNATNYFNSVQKVKARNIAELVRFMRDRSLQLAPATEKDEAAYVALYQALIILSVGMPSIDDKTDPEEAERLLSGLLADPAKAKQASLWRQAAGVAERRKQYDSALQRLRRALELEKDRPRDLPSLRRDFAWFVNLAQERVQELIRQHRSVPRELREGVMAIADQWRAVDPVDWLPCDLTARILSRAGDRELAWSYLTSPTRLQRGTASDWLELALRLDGRSEHDLAERAYAVAASLEPNNAEIIWERALNHLAAGRRDTAQALLKQLDKGTWPEHYRVFQLRARRALEEGRD